MSGKIDRRDFMRFAAGGVLGAGASAAGLTGISRLNGALGSEEVRVPGGPEAWALGVCSLCPAGCGLRVRCIGKRAVKVQGNPLHPVNRGGLCPKGAALLQELYHPDRLRAPLKNIGTRTAPRWREVSWDEAVSTLAAKLRQLRAARNERGLVLIDGQDRTLGGRLMRRFLAAYGSPNYFAMPSGLDALQTAVFLQQGVTAPVAWDAERTRYLLSFGVDVLEGWGAPTAVMRAFGKWRDPAEGRRTKFVQIEPRLSVTAARADEWVPLRPGTEAALALGIAYVLITEELYDQAFVRDHTSGFDDWRDAAGTLHPGFRSLVLSEYRLDDVASLTDVPAETILRIAREFARNRPAVALGDAQTSTVAGDPRAAMAVHCLNALAGSIDAPGGLLCQMELPLAEGVPSGSGAVTEAFGRAFPGNNVYALPEAILKPRDYRVQAVLLHRADPVFAAVDGGRWREALAAAPFVASFTTFLDDSSAMADLILPATTGLEQWQAATTPPAWPFPLVSLAAPVIAARHRTRNPADIFLGLARTIGGPVAAALPFSGFEDYLKSEVNALFAAQAGSVFSGGIEEKWSQLLERSGWWAPTFSKPEELWEQMKQRGGWWDGEYAYGEWERVLGGASRRFEFCSERLAAPVRAGVARLTPLEPAPSDRPMQLLVFETLPLARGEGAHLPYLQQIAGPHLDTAWETWVEIHPATAKKYGIGDGDAVWIESSRGRARAQARIYEGARPGALHMPLGYGHGAGPAWGRAGSNALALLEPEYEGIAGLPRAAAFVKVYRA